jgi:hypothetical protein
MTPPQKSDPAGPRNSLSVEIGGWFRAYATGLGVIAIPLVIVLLGGFSLLARYLLAR